MTPGAFTYSGTELDAMAGARNYYAALLDRFAPHIGAHAVEVGAGVGTFASLLLERSGVSEMTLIEPAENNFPLLQMRFASDSRVRVAHGYLAEHADSLAADSLIMVNVAEHVSDDLALFRDAHRALRPGGKLLILVPALMPLYGTLDEAFGHFRRYTRAELDGRLAEAGFHPLTIRYVNSAGIFAWFIAGRLLRQRTLHARGVRLYDRLVIPWLSRLERFWSPPFGQSLLAIARA